MVMRTSVQDVFIVEDALSTAVGGAAVRAAGAKRKRRASGGGGTDLRSKLEGPPALHSRAAGRHARTIRDEPLPRSRSRTMTAIWWNADVAVDRPLPHYLRMRMLLAVLLFGALTGAHVANAKSRIPAPTASQIKAALNDKSESDLNSYLQTQPPGTATGHVVRVDAVTGLTCDPLPQSETVLCRFIAHQGLVDKPATATLARRSDGWHIIDQ